MERARTTAQSHARGRSRCSAHTAPSGNLNLGQFRPISRVRAIIRAYLHRPASAGRVIWTKGAPERFPHAPAFARDSDDVEFSPYGGGTAFLAQGIAYEHPPPPFHTLRDCATRSSDCTVVRTETQRESCVHSATWGPKFSLFSRARPVNWAYLYQIASAGHVLRTPSTPERFPPAPSFARRSDDFHISTFRGGSISAVEHVSGTPKRTSPAGPHNLTAWAECSNDVVVGRPETHRTNCA